MMKKVMWVAVIIILLVGCKSNLVNKEAYNGEHYINYTNVPNIITFLGLKEVNVVTLEESNNALSFCFNDKNINGDTAIYTYYGEYFKAIEGNQFLLMQENMLYSKMSRYQIHTLIILEILLLQLLT